MSEKAEVKSELPASDTANSGSTSAPETDSKDSEKNDVNAAFAVQAKRDTQIASVADAEPTIESQDESLAAEPGTAEESGPHNKGRRRVRGVLKRLQDQVEFYFGDANLHKDRFLKEKIAEHPDRYVPVETIASFNKMMALTEEVNLVVQAMEKSPLLELSDDKKLVRRAMPLAPVSQSDIDARTVYVENLQKNADHHQLKKLFTPFGTVVYISLPRYKSSNAHKGFAFVEFLAANEAQKAVEFFKSKEEKEETSDRNNGESVFIEGKDKPNADTELSDLEGDVTRKRGRDEMEQTSAETRDTEVSSTKRIKTEEEAPAATSDLSRHQESPVAEPIPSSTAATSKLELVKALAGRKRTHDEADEGTDQDEEDDKGAKAARLDSTMSEASALDGEGGVEDEATHKKKRQRKHRKRKESVARQLNDLKLRVISKAEWLEMKELYKKMQKEEMKKLKEENKLSKAKPQHSKMFVEHCLIRLTHDGPEKLNKEKLREVCSEYGEVAYIDVGVGENESYVRFAATGCAEKLLEATAVLEEKIAGVSFGAVSEEEEKDYFRRTRIARKQRWSGKKKKWTRGQDKVVSQALHRQQHQAETAVEEGMASSAKSTGMNKHIRFSDSD